MVPKKDTLRVAENKADKRNTKTIPRPDTKNQDLGKTILPSENLAAAQKIIETAKPITKSKPFEVSIGIFEKGKKKIGNNTTTTNKDQNETLSKVFDNIIFLRPP